MKTKTEPILAIMNALTWIVFIGLLIRTGAILVSYIVSFVNPEAAHNLYEEFSLMDLRQSSFQQYTMVVSLLVGLSGLKAYIAYLVTRISLKINFSRPFTSQVASLIEEISHTALGAGVVALIADGYSDWLIKRGADLPKNWGSSEFLFLAGVIFVIAQVFKKGVDIQSENELTI